jgi:protein-S-isoprenylcysteine O-methyltransferase Ste14
MMAPFVKVFVILACFSVFHSLSSGESIKASIRTKAGLSFGAYAGLRSLFSLSLLVLSVVVLFRNTHSTYQIFPPTYGLPAILPAMLSIWIAGTALGQVAKAVRLPQFFGFKEYPKLFIFTGAYSICRHPMYAGWLIASWGLLLSKPYLLTLLYNFLLSLFVVYMALQEEKQMVALFGDKYSSYQRQVPFLLPYGFLKKRVHEDSTPRL